MLLIMNFIFPSSLWVFWYLPHLISYYHTTVQCLINVGKNGVLESSISNLFHYLLYIISSHYLLMSFIFSQFQLPLASIIPKKQIHWQCYLSLKKCQKNQSCLILTVVNYFLLFTICNNWFVLFATYKTLMILLINNIFLLLVSIISFTFSLSPDVILISPADFLLLQSSIRFRFTYKIVFP